ncbi:Peptidase C1 domain containing protein, partial [Asbolus verrucosus]
DRPPPRKNWKKEQFVTPVEDQGDDCKASWAFSTIGAIESNFAIKHGKDKLFILSAQNLIDCTNVYGNDSCLGGRPQDALHYVYEEGIMNEDDYPYEGLDRPCEYDQSKSITNLSKYRRIPSGKEEKLKKVVGLRGPVVVSIHATEKFSFYNNGIFYDKSCTSVSSNLNYSVLVVGYDDIDDKKYWILKNSMGTKWGINGYMYLARNKKNHCGIATDAFLPVLP